MPTPIEVHLHPISIAAFAIHAGLILGKRIAPAEKLADVRAWPSARPARVTNTVLVAGSE